MAGTHSGREADALGISVNGSVFAAPVRCGMTDALAILGGYLLGSLPFGYWVPRLVRGEDIRTKGSGNVGASNVFRVYGRSLGVPVALLDLAKGFAAASLGLWVGGALDRGSRRRGRDDRARAPGVPPLPEGREDGRDRRWRDARARAARRVLLRRRLARGLPRHALRVARVDRHRASRLPSSSWLFGYPWPIVVFGVAGAVAVIACTTRTSAGSSPAPSTASSCGARAGVPLAAEPGGERRLLRARLARRELARGARRRSRSARRRRRGRGSSRS